MNKKYGVQTKGSLFVVKDKPSGYELIIKNPPIPMRFDLGYAHFMTPTPCGSIPRKFMRRNKIPVTGRDVTDYPPGVSELRIAPGLQYVEVGAGLGDFIPNVVCNLRGNTPKPTVIEPVNYQKIQDMLIYAIKNVSVPAFVRFFLEELLERSKLITNPEEVNLINLRLSEAVEKHPELIGCADVVVDSCGPQGYSESEMLPEDLKHPRSLRNRTQKRVSGIEKSLLKPSGEFFFFE